MIHIAKNPNNYWIQRGQFGDRQQCRSRIVVHKTPGKEFKKL